VLGNPPPSGLLKIPNDRRQEARRPGILAPDNPPLKRVFKKTPFLKKRQVCGTNVPLN
jgi:hypothetical protein